MCVRKIDFASPLGILRNPKAISGYSHPSTEVSIRSTLRDLQRVRRGGREGVGYGGDRCGGAGRGLVGGVSRRSVVNGINGGML